ncbi:MAG: hypothetical protein QM831_21975 [Kofleriaceae bacterium]
MKKKKFKRSLKRNKAAARTRNAAAAAPTSSPRPRARSIARAIPPDWKSIVAAVAGGAGSAALGGLVVNQQILSPEATGIGLMLGGGATAYFSSGTTRIVGTSIAAAGAGQFALAFMNKRALKAHDEAHVKTPASAAAQLPAAPPAVRQSADAGASVVEMFRDAANDLDVVEDEMRYGVRDAMPDSDEPIVIDLDEAA